MGPQRPSPSDIPHETDVLVPFEIQNIPSEPRLRCHPSLETEIPACFREKARAACAFFGGNETCEFAWAQHSCLPPARLIFSRYWVKN